MIDWEFWPEGGFHRAISATHGHVLVMFGASGCAACAHARRVVPEWVSGRVERLVYMDAGVAGGLVRELGVFHLPAFFLWSHGRYHAALSPRFDARAWAEALLAAQQAPAAEAP